MKQNVSFLKKIKNKNKTSGKWCNILKEWGRDYRVPLLYYIYIIHEWHICMN